jgi:hypothetical protein
MNGCFGLAVRAFLLFELVHLYGWWAFLIGFMVLMTAPYNRSK